LPHRTHCLEPSPSPPFPPCVPERHHGHGEQRQRQQRVEADDAVPQKQRLAGREVPRKRREHPVAAGSQVCSISTLFPARLLPEGFAKPVAARALELVAAPAPTGGRRPGLQASTGWGGASAAASAEATRRWQVRGWEGRFIGPRPPPTQAPPREGDLQGWQPYLLQVARHRRVKLLQPGAGGVRREAASSKVGTGV
jgi:hypothetical protein